MSDRVDDKLRRNLDGQQALAIQLESLLQQERDAILARQWPALVQVSRDKDQCVARLQVLHAELSRLAGTRPIADWLVGQGLSAEHAELMQRAARLAQRNREAYSLLERQQQRVGAALRLLGTGQGPALYGRRGLSPAVAPRRSWAAA